MYFLGVQFFGSLADPFDEFFIGLLDDGDEFFELLVVPLGSFHDFEEDLVGTAPLLAEALFLQEGDFDVVDANLPDGSFEMRVVVAVETGVVAYAAVQLFPDLHCNYLAHFPVNLTDLVIAEQFQRLNDAKFTFSGTVRSGVCPLMAFSIISRISLWFLATSLSFLYCSKASAYCCLLALYLLMMSSSFCW